MCSYGRFEIYLKCDFVCKWMAFRVRITPFSVHSIHHACAASQWGAQHPLLCTFYPTRLRSKPGGCKAPQVENSSMELFQHACAASQWGAQHPPLRTFYPTRLRSKPGGCKAPPVDNQQGACVASQIWLDKNKQQGR